MGFRSGGNDSRGTKRHRGDQLVSGSIRGRELHLIHGAVNFNTAAQKFLPMGYNDTETAGGSYTSRFVAPTEGRWIKTYLRSSVAGDTCLVKLYKALDGTSNPDVLMETVSVECDAASTTFEFSSTGSSGIIHFNEGDALAFRFDPETQPDLTNFTHVLELYTREDIEI
tara:strand:- start:875 stop:1381 length:507 start_codon:yes stop_codon:yes gene_type:complete